MSAVFCGQALASTESATSGQSAASQCLSALQGRREESLSIRDRPSEKVLDGRIRTSAHITPIRRLPSDSAPVGVINTAVTRGKKEFHSRGGGGPVHKDQSP